MQSTDAFGPVVPRRPEPDGWYRVEADVDISPTFFAWCCHFTHGFRIEGPEPVVAQMCRHLESIVSPIFNGERRSFGIVFKKILLTFC